MTVPSLPPSPLSRSFPASSSSASGSGTAHAAALQRSLAMLKANYAAAAPSRFRRTRTGLGGGADAHLLSPQQFRDLREYARDMDRNDGVIGQLVDRAIVNYGHLSPKPDTGDKGLDAELKARWQEYSEDPLQVDAAGKFAFPEVEAMVARHEIIDGDFFVLPLDDGTVQLVEGEWCDSPMRAGGDVIHGIRLDERKRPVEYTFLKERPESRFAHIYPLVHEVAATIPAFDEDGEPRVLHLYSPQRTSQTRGVTAFRACFDVAGMVEDVNFAKLVQQQVVSCIAAFLERSADFAIGERDDSTTSTIEEIAPGLILRGKKGEKLTAFSPNVPNAEYFEHIRLLLRIIGCNIGMPLELVLLDFTDTNFSGHRCAVQQAQLGFMEVRNARKRRLHRPIWRWKVRSWLERGELGASAASLGKRLYKHDWTGSGYPYVDPKTDAEADKVRLDNMLASPRDIALERGQDWETTAREAAEDRELAADLLIEAAKRIKAKHGVEIHWRDLGNLSTPAGVQGAAGKQEPPPEPVDEEKPKQEAKAAAEVLRAEFGARLEASVADLRLELAKARGEARTAAALEKIADRPPAAPPIVNVAAPAVAVQAAAPPDLAPLADAMGGVAAAIAGKECRVEVLPAAVNPSFNVPQAPAPTVHVEAKPGELRVAVEAKLPPRPDRTATITDLPGGGQKITINGEGE